MITSEQFRFVKLTKALRVFLVMMLSSSLALADISIFPMGPIDGTYEVTQGSSLVLVKTVDAGGRGDLAGLKPGDGIYGAFGKMFTPTGEHHFGVTQELGFAIDRAEGENGVLPLMVLRPGVGLMAVNVQLDAVGAYGPAYPLNSAKSEALHDAAVADLHERVIASNGNMGYLTGFTGLCLLGHTNWNDTTGDKPYRLSINLLRDAAITKITTWQYISLEKDLLDKSPNPNFVGGAPSNWDLGTMMMFLAEYYKKTGDESVKPILQRGAEMCANTVQWWKQPITKNDRPTSYDTIAGMSSHSGVTGDYMHLDTNGINMCGVQNLNGMGFARHAGVDMSVRPKDGHYFGFDLEPGDPIPASIADALPSSITLPRYAADPVRGSTIDNPFYYDPSVDQKYFMQMNFIARRSMGGYANTTHITYAPGAGAHYESGGRTPATLLALAMYQDHVGGLDADDLNRLERLKTGISNHYMIQQYVHTFCVPGQVFQALASPYLNDRQLQYYMENWRFYQALSRSSSYDVLYVSGRYKSDRDGYLDNDHCASINAALGYAVAHGRFSAIPGFNTQRTLASFKSPKLLWPAIAARTLTTTAATENFNVDICDGTGNVLAPSAYTATWSHVSGPAPATFSSTNTANTTITLPSVSATPYRVRLTVTRSGFPDVVELIDITRTAAPAEPVAVSITQQPAPQVTSPGGAATFDIAVTGTGPFVYQWRRNGVALWGTSASSALILNNVNDAYLGNYDCIVTSPSGSLTSNTASLTFNTQSVRTKGILRREIWTGLGGGAVSSLTTHANYPDTPNVTTTVNAFEATTYGDNYGQKISGWITAPITGEYKFFVTADDSAELLLSTDENSENLVSIATVASWVTHRKYSAGGKSGFIPLIAGQKYYVELLHKEASGGDAVSVAWQLPGGAVPADNSEPISGDYLESNQYLPKFSHHWKLNETSGTVCNDFVGSTNITILNGGTRVTGVSEKAVSLNGVDQSVSGVVQLSENMYAVSMWFRTTQANGGLFSATNADGSVYDRDIYLNGGNLSARLSPNEVISSTGANYADGQWHHVVHTFGGAIGGQKLYVDGVQVASGALVQSDFVAQTHLRVGASKASTTEYFKGEIDEVRVYETGLSLPDALVIRDAGLNAAPVMADKTFLVSESTPAGTTVGSMTASDENAGQTLTYSITSGNIGDRFSINPSTGVITQNMQLDFETSASHILTIRVTDTGNPVQSTSATAAIVVEYDESAGGDSDRDGMRDSWEITHFGSVYTQTGSGDADGDKLTNAQENLAGTDPNLVDTDSDMYSDGFEVTKGTNPLDANEFPNNLAVAYWDFNDATEAGVSRDIIGALPGALSDGAVLSPSQGGKSAQAGDRSLDLGATNAKQRLDVINPKFLNKIAASNEVTISYWQKSNHGSTTTSTFWGVSPSSATNSRGMQAHTPNGTGYIYFDTGGDGVGQRTSKYVSGVTWGNWNHITLVRKPNIAEVWINGVLRVSGNNIQNIPTDFTRLHIGSGINGAYSMMGQLDDFAVYRGALTPGQIAALADGASPDSITDNDAPSFDSDELLAEEATEDELYSDSLATKASDPNGDDLTFTKVAGPAWLTITSNGTMSGTPTNANVGVNTFTVRVADPQGSVDEATVSITVTNVNDQPSFVSDPINMSATEDAALTGQLSATDPDAGDTKTYSKVSGPAWLTVSDTGVLGGTPLNANVGANGFVVRVTDDNGASATATLNITVQNVNDAPTFASDPFSGAAATEDVAYSGNISGNATDPDAGDTKIFSKVSGPAWLIIENSGALSGTPTNTNVGPNSFSVKVTDGSGLSDTAVLNIIVNNVNDVPTWSAATLNLPDATASQGYSRSIAAEASDVDAGDSLQFSKVSGPAWLSVELNGTLAGTPTSTDIGTNNFILRVTDIGGLSADVAVSINVIAGVDNDGTWTNPAGGVWSTSSNWSGGTVANGIGKTANFSTLNITADTTVNITGARTIGNMTFADATTASHKWTINGDALNLAVTSGVPTIAVNNQTTQFNNQLTGIDGLAKTGAGNLTLAGANSYSGLTTITPVGDTTAVTAANSAAFGSSTLLLNGANTYRAGLSVNAGLTIANNLTLKPGTGRAVLGLLGNANWSGDIVVDGSASATNLAVVGVAGSSTNPSVISGSISRTLGSNNTLALRNSNSYGNVTGSISYDTGTIQLLDATHWQFSNASNTWGKLDISNAGANAYVGATNALSVTGVVSSTSSGILRLNNITATNSYDQTTAGLAGNVRVTLTTGSAELTLNTTADQSSSGVISGAISLVKTGSAMQTLSGINTYTGTTAIRKGILNLTGTLAAGAVSVENGGTLSGNGTIGGATTVASGGTLAPTGTLTISNALNLAGSTAIKLVKTGATLTSDSVQGVSTLTFGGTLDVTATGDSLVAGDTFTLFSAANYSGTFSSFNLPALSAGLVWKTSNLAVNGTLSVEAATFSLSYSAGANGTLSGSSSQTVNYNASGTAVTAVPNANYRFTNWSDGSTSNPRTDTDVVNNITVTANFELDIVAPTIATGSATNVAISTAQVGYTLSNTGGENPSVTLFYGTTDGGSNASSWQSSQVVGTIASGSGSAALASLEGGTKYYYTFRAVNSAGTAWGSSGSFTTLSDNSPKLVRTVIDSVSSTSWTSVELGRSYTSPVVIATPIYPNNTVSPVVTRIRNVTTTGFEVKIDRADGQTGEVTRDVSIVVVDEGVYTIAEHGVKMEAVKFTNTTTASKFNWVAEQRAYQNTYQKPVVLGQVMSANDEDWSVFWCKASSRTSAPTSQSLYMGKMVGEDPDFERANETIGYIVIESGNGMIDGVKYAAGLGSDSVLGVVNSTTGYSYPVSGLTTASVAALTKVAADGIEGGWAVLFGNNAVSPTNLQLAIDSDTVYNSVRNHTTEQVSFLVFE